MHHIDNLNRVTTYIPQVVPPEKHKMDIQYVNTHSEDTPCKSYAHTYHRRYRVGSFSACEQFPAQRYHHGVVRYS